jgi:hypothetical protein
LGTVRLINNKRNVSLLKPKMTQSTDTWGFKDGLTDMLAQNTVISTIERAK